LVASKRKPSFINQTRDEVIAVVVNHIEKIQDQFCSPSKRSALSVGVDATVVVPVIQLYEGVMIDSALPNHCIPVPNTEDPDAVKCILQRFAEEKDNFVVAKEIKVVVLSFQNTPKGMCPYFTLASLPQTVNKSNTFGEYILDACLAAAKTVQNVALLNQTTDGVSCEVQWNLTRMKSYLERASNHISVPDPNHNLKNLRFQI
jgi:hypothetical protein